MSARDDDLLAFTHDALIDEVERLRAGIRAHRDSERQELCWHHPQLWALLPERTDPLPIVPSWPDFLHGCLRYRRSLDAQRPDTARVHDAIVASFMWRRVDVPGHDACVLIDDSDSNTWRLDGTAVFAHQGPAPVRLAYEVECDRAWKPLRARVDGTIGDHNVALLLEHDGEGRWLRDGAPIALDEQCVDVDFGFTPATNLPHLRRASLQIGDEREVIAAWLDINDDTITPLRQTYRRVDETTYHYEAPRIAYAAELVLDARTGFVREYPGLWSAALT